MLHRAGGGPMRFVETTICVTVLAACVEPAPNDWQTRPGPTSVPTATTRTWMPVSSVNSGNR